MARTMKERIKKLATPIICGAVVLASVGATAFAAGTGSITGRMTGNFAKVTLNNTSGSTRYCCVAINEYDDALNPIYYTVNVNSGNISDGKSLLTSGTVEMKYALGQGSIYRGGSPLSGIDVGYEISLK